MERNINARLQYIVFLVFSAAVFILILTFTSVRFTEGDRFLELFIEKNGLENAVSEEWYCYRGSFGDCGSVMYWALDKYEQDGIYFLLQQLESNDNTKIAVALDELTFALKDGMPGFPEPVFARLLKAKENAREIILEYNDKILQLAASDNKIVREHAVRLLSETGDKDIVPGLQELAGPNFPEEVRANAIDGLSMFYWEFQHSFPKDLTLAEKIMESVEKYLSDSQVVVRMAAVSALDTGESAERIREMQRDNDIRVRVIAALKLYVAGLKCDYETLVSGMYSSEIDKDIKLKIAYELSRQGEKRVIPVFAELIGDPDVLRGWGIDVIGGHYGNIADAMAGITGLYYGPPEDSETLEQYGNRIKSDALRWWEKHKN